MKIREINIDSPEYPESLKHIYNPPRALFVSGRILPEDNNAVAIVGTRLATHYGMEQCRKIACELAARGITIISGMARGIDTAAHKGAISAGGRTIAILGSGHGRVYPPENKKLYGEISEKGAVISEYENETPPLKTNFPRRNRIISGMSKGVLVVEAAAKSGALITADFALEQGREVFAMPGNISSVKSSGTNKLIKDGAKLVETAEDILEELKNVITYGLTVSASRAPKVAALSEEEKAAVLVLGDTPKSLDEISQDLNLPTGKVSQILLKLEFKKLARVLPGENFVRV